MIILRGWRAAAAGAACLAAVLVPAAMPSSSAAASAPQSAVLPADLPEPPAADVARAELADLVVEAPHAMAGYSRAKFPHWASQGQNCDTREVVLQRDGQDVKADEQCRAISGTWTSAYDGKVLTSASQIDVDHIVPLANAWRSGADTWTTARRKAFANDLEGPQLLAVSASSNRAKGDQSPDQWSPPDTAYWCVYARAWTHVKTVYGLSATDPEKAKLAQMLDTCPANV